MFQRSLCTWLRKTSSSSCSLPRSVCPHRSHFTESLLSPSADEIEETGLFLFCLGAAQLSLFICLCAAYKAALSPSFLPQRIRHAECWGPLHTKRLGIRRRRPQCGLRDSDQIPNLNRISNIKQIGGGCFWRLFIDCIYCWRELSKICRCYQRQIIHSLLESTWNSSAVHTHLKSFI